MSNFKPGQIVKIVGSGCGMNPDDIGKLCQIVSSDAVKDWKCVGYEGYYDTLWTGLPGFSYSTGHPCLLKDFLKDKLYGCSGSSMFGEPTPEECIKAGIQAATAVTDEDDWSILDKPEEDFSCLNNL